MKPIDAARRLQECAHLLAAGQPLPPSLRAWLPPALLRRVLEPKTSLDRLLGLRSRAGGRGGHLGSAIPERNRLPRVLAANLPGDTQTRAAHIARLSREGDAALAGIPGRIPGMRQLQRILADDG